MARNKPSATPEVMTEAESEADKVSGNTNATYGPVPKASQLFSIAFLEIAPTPVPVDQMFFILLRGYIPSEKRVDEATLEKLLASATLTISLSAILSNGKHEEEKNYTVPLRTIAFADLAHLLIRDAKGANADHLGTGRNDILVDFCILGMFLRTGTWSLKAVGELEDGTCLFAIQLTQWLAGRLEE